MSKTSVQNYLRDGRRGRSSTKSAPKTTVVNDLDGSQAAGKGSGHSFEFRAAALVELGRHVDHARAKLEPAQARYEEACRRWDEAVAKLPCC